MNDLEELERKLDLADELEKLTVRELELAEKLGAMDKGDYPPVEEHLAIVLVSIVAAENGDMELAIDYTNRSIAMFEEHLRELENGGGSGQATR